MPQRVVIVTGASQGIGAAIARRLAQDGFRVALVARHAANLERVAQGIKEAGGTAFVALADVTNRAEIFRVVDQTVAHFGDLHVMINNAGVAPTNPIDVVTEAELTTVMRVNVGGTLWGIQAAHAAFQKLGHPGKIINATSQAGVVGNPSLATYSASKFAVRGITQTAAREFAAEGTTVNAFAPGIVATPMMEGIAQKLAQQAGADPAAGLAPYADHVALKRLATPADVANAVAFLTGPDSDYITGQTLEVDGGMQFH